VPVLAEPARPAPPAAPSRLQAAFFSGGVDSFFTALDDGDGLGVEQRGVIDELLCLWGFDIPIHDRVSFLRLRDSLQRAASELGKVLVDTATNLRRTRWRFADWELLAHGPALAATALCLERRYGKVLIPSSMPTRRSPPWGSQYLTDPLFSTSRMAIRQDGGHATRFEKLERIAPSDTAMRFLRVCFASRSTHNCGRCQKCLRTMLGLELLGALPRCSTFGAGSVDLRLLRAVRVGHSYLVQEFLDLRRGAEDLHRPDIVAAIDAVLARSARARSWLHAKRRAKRYLARKLARCWRPAGNFL
jgi:hypothetical protein